MKYWCLTCAKHTTSLTGDDEPHRCSICSPEAQRARHKAIAKSKAAARRSSGTLDRRGATATKGKAAATNISIPDGWRDLEFLYYIVPIENLGSVLNLGILSHERACRLQHMSLADEEVQMRRDRKVIPVNGRRIHECANVYINPRNAMMYRLVSNQPAGSFAVVNLAAESVLRMAGAAISDRNAAVGNAKFFESPDGLGRLDRSSVFAAQWSQNGRSDDALKQAMMAEVLVPDSIPSSAICSVTVASMGTAAILRQKHPGTEFTVDGNPFFQ